MRGIFRSVIKDLRAEGLQFFEGLFAVGRGLNRIAPQRDHAGQSRALRLLVIYYCGPL